MYIPSFNKFEDLREIVGFMQRYSFATIVTVIDGIPVATHLPFLVKQTADKIVLRSHFASANPQAKNSAGKNVLVIFTEPHAYISPKNYEKEQNVPTWNYLAVHAYGNLTLIDNEEQKAELLKETIITFEKDYLKQWDGLPDQFKQGMMKGITAFEIVVDDLEAKAKLSQNRTVKEQENVIQDLSQSANSSEKEIAGYMAKLNKLE